MNKLKAILLLIFLSPILTEIITSSTPPTVFFNPATLAFSILLVYGIPVLVIREFAVRYKLGLAGIFSIGITYGIFSEGLLAKTSILNNSLPVGAYDQYGYIFGISFPWTITISTWHALAAVSFPILITHILFPNEREKLWLNKKLTIILAALLLIFASMIFLDKSAPVAGTPIQLAILLALMFAGVLIAKFIPRKIITPEDSSTVNKKPIFLGLSIFLFTFVILSFIASQKLPVTLFFLVFGLGVWFYIRTLKIHSWLNAPHFMLFGIGFYMQQAALAIAIRFAAGSTTADTLIAGIVIEIFLFWFAIKILKKYK